MKLIKLIKYLKYLYFFFYKMRRKYNDEKSVLIDANQNDKKISNKLALVFYEGLMGALHMQIDNNLKRQKFLCANKESFISLARQKKSKFSLIYKYSTKAVNERFISKMSRDAGRKQ